MRIFGFFALICGLAFGTAAFPDTVTYFEDTFDGNDMLPEWKLINPNPDAYLVEAGRLTILATDGVPVTYAESTNVLRLDKPVPSGDWTMTVRFFLTPQTMGENMRIGLAKDNENSLFASMNLSSYNYNKTNIYLKADKLSRGEASGFQRSAFEIKDRDIEVRSGLFTNKVAAAELRLKKTGRKYQAAIRFEPTTPGAKSAVSDEWITVQKLTSLRSPGDAFVVMFGSASNDYTPSGGEGLVEIDFVRIEVDE